MGHNIVCMSNNSSTSAKSFSGLIATAVFVSSFALASFAEAASCSIYVDSNYTGGQTTLRWTSTSDASSAYINNGVGTVSLIGTYNVGYAADDRTYTMTVYVNNGQSSTCQATVYANGYNYNNSQRPTCTITQTGYGIGAAYPYESATLSWSSWNATSATISPIVGSVGVNGSQAIYPSGYQIYTMTVSGPGGTNTCRTELEPSIPPTNSYGNLYCTISASPTNIQNGSSSYLTWTSYGARSAWLSDSIGTVAVNGSLMVRPEASRVYTLTITDDQGRTNTCQATVSVAGSTVKLTQIPYTGDFGPLGTALAWLAVVLLAGAGASGIALRSRMFGGR